MTPEEFAEAHGLSLEEAELILAARAKSTVGPIPSPQKPSRAALARVALEKAQQKVGVQPVVVTELGIQKGYDEVAEENLDKFYQNKGGVKSTQGKFVPPVPVEDASQDPEDW